MISHLRKKYKLNHKTLNKDKNTLLDAVALQDHYAKQIKFKPLKIFNKRVKLPPVSVLPYQRPRKRRHRTQTFTNKKNLN